LREKRELHQVLGTVEGTRFRSLGETFDNERGRKKRKGTVSVAIGGGKKETSHVLRARERRRGSSRRPDLRKGRKEEKDEGDEENHLTRPRARKKKPKTFCSKRGERVKLYKEGEIDNTGRDWSGAGRGKRKESSKEPTCRQRGEQKIVIANEDGE